jgi:hypothetical protein
MLRISACMKVLSVLGYCVRRVLRGGVVKALSALGVEVVSVGSTESASDVWMDLQSIRTSGGWVI